MRQARPLPTFLFICCLCLLIPQRICCLFPSIPFPSITSFTISVRAWKGLFSCDMGDGPAGSVGLEEESAQSGDPSCSAVCACLESRFKLPLARQMDPADGTLISIHSILVHSGRLRGAGQRLVPSGHPAHAPHPLSPLSPLQVSLPPRPLCAAAAKRAGGPMMLSAQLKDRPGISSPFSSVRAKIAKYELPPTSSSSSADPSITPPVSSLRPHTSQSGTGNGQKVGSASMEGSTGPSVSRLPPSPLANNSASLTGDNSSAVPSSTSRRKKVDNYTSENEDTAPPPVPLKPYPPKIEYEEPTSPFQLTFANGAQNSPSKIPRPTNVRRPLNAPKPSIAAVVAAKETAVTNRESTYSLASSTGGEGRFSGVVTTANAISLQRAAAHTRAMGDVTASSASPRSASVEKGTGVKTRRRKSRESSTTRRSSRRSSFGGAGADEAEKQEKESMPQLSKTHLAAKVDYIDATRDAGKASKVTPPVAVGDASTSSEPKSTSPLPKTARLQPLDISRASNLAEPDRQWSASSGETAENKSVSTSNRYLSPITPTFGPSPRKRSMSSETSTDYQFLNPLSDAWGQNSSVAAETSMEESGDASVSSIFASSAPQRHRAISITSVGSSVSGPRVSASTSLSAIMEAGALRTEAASGSHRRHLLASSSFGSKVGGSEKDELLNQLLSSMALVDAQSYESFKSIEEVESYKKELVRVEKRIVDVQHKLKVEMRVRDAADKLRRAGTRRIQHGRTPSGVSLQAGSQPSHHRMPSTTSVTGPVDSSQAEADVALATKRTDAICKELMELKEKAMGFRKRVLEHQTRVLALRVDVLEEEQADQWQAAEQEERGKVGANLAIEEVEKIRDKLQRAEKSLEHERRDREEEVSRWRKKYEADQASWTTKTDDEGRKWEQKVDEALRAHKAAMVDRESEHANLIAQEHTRRNEVEQHLEEQAALLMEREAKVDELQHQLEQLQFERTAERNIMAERQQLFSAFEKRLLRAESRLREEDDRCARLLGKVDGREEMDTMLEQIKAGYGAVKKEKTAGQDIDGLIDGIAMHIGDLEDELNRGRPDSSRAFQSQLDSMERELEGWKSEAESAKRSLAAMQRQSAVSHTSFGMRMSTYGRSPTLRSGSTFLSANGTSEAEARLALMEKRNAALEEELADARLPSTTLPSSPPVKVAGSNGSSSDTREAELLASTMQSLLGILPALDAACTDLQEIQHSLGEGEGQRGPPIDDVEDRCHEVVERSRALVTLSAMLAERTRSCEAKREDFEVEVGIMEGKCEELRTALEDLRRGHATQMAREQTLQSTVNDLRKSLTAKSTIEMTMGKISTASSVSSGITSAAPTVIVSRSLGNSVIGRRKGVPQPLSISPSSSSLSFTPSPTRPGQTSTDTPPATATSAKTSSPTVLVAPPRTMTLGMDTAQMRGRIRQLENELIQTRSKPGLTLSPPKAPAPPLRPTHLHEELLKELEENRRELDYVKGVESRQRIDLL